MGRDACLLAEDIVECASRPEPVLRREALDILSALFRRTYEVRYAVAVDKRVEATSRRPVYRLRQIYRIRPDYSTEECKGKVASVLPAALVVSVVVKRLNLRCLCCMSPRDIRSCACSFCCSCCPCCR